MNDHLQKEVQRLAKDSGVWYRSLYAQDIREICQELLRLQGTEAPAAKALSIGAESKTCGDCAKHVPFEAPYCPRGRTMAIDKICHPEWFIPKNEVQP